MKLLTLLTFVTTAAAVALAALDDGSLVPTIVHPQLGDADKYFEFDFQFTEYCQGGTNNGRSHLATSMWGVGTEIPKRPRATWLELLDLGRFRSLGMSFDDQNSRVNFVYGNCNWGMDQWSNCALCFTRENWSSGSLNCDGGITASRTFRSLCYIDMDAQNGVAEDDHSQAKALTARQTPPEVSRYAIMSAQDDTQTAADSPVFQSPKVIQTPTDHEGVYQLTLPFQLQIIEYCKDGAPEAIATYRNGNIGVWNMPLSSNSIYYVDHLVPGFTNLGVGPYDFNKSEVDFIYACNEYSCGWKETESDKQCGSCRAGAWSRGPLSCAVAGEILRIKDLECSFVLGFSVP